MGKIKREKKMEFSGEKRQEKRERLRAEERRSSANDRAHGRATGNSGWWAAAGLRLRYRDHPLSSALGKAGCLTSAH